LKLFFIKTGEELEYQYRPEEKLMDSIGALFIEKCGLLLQPQINNQTSMHYYCYYVNLEQKEKLTFALCLIKATMFFLTK